MTLLAQDDPYHALGLTKEATAAEIKTAYRKLVLKHHPDKVQDETLKQAAADLFHKVQSAWEKIGDEEKRSRYDAKAHLDSLRKEVSERERPYGGARPDMRPQGFRTDSRSSYQAPRDHDRTSYRTEEIRPPGAEYFSERPADHRDFDVQRERPKRTPPKDDRRSKLNREDSKEAERMRQREKVRQTTKATNRDRDYKYSYAQPEVDSASDSDPYDRRRSPRERVDERRPSERYFDTGRRQSEDTSARYVNERLQRRQDDARDYIERTARRQYSDSARRPSPSRVSSRDHTDYVKDASGRPVAIRRGSGRPKTLSRDDSDMSRRPRREAERSSGEYEDHPRRPPAMPQAKSAPMDIHLPYEKPRANSAQLTTEQMREFIPSPIKRADSMPQQPTVRSKPMRSSTLRQTQFNDDYDIRKPAQSYPAARSPKEYADDREKPTPDGYIIEPREPSRRVTRSPEPMREKSRSSRYPSQNAPLSPINTRVTSYAYTDKGAEPLPSRPKLSRESSSRKDSYLFGEVPSSPRDRAAYSSDSARVQEVKPTDYKMSSVHGQRSGTARSPSYMRSNSFQPVSA